MLHTVEARRNRDQRDLHARLLGWGFGDAAYVGVA
jgi:hypothetical protein